MRKIKTPDYRERQVFGVPLLVVAQRTGQPLPTGIQTALKYLRDTSLDQVSNICCNSVPPLYITLIKLTVRQNNSSSNYCML